MNCPVKSFRLRRRRSGFTLLELLVVVAVIGILASLILPALHHAKNKARRIQCVSNLKQLVTGAIMYADDDPGGNFSAAVWEADRNLNWLHPSYIPSVKSFICPATRNSIRPDVSFHVRTGEPGLLDLFDMAGGRSGEFGTSYLLSGFMGWRTPYYTEIRVLDRVERLPFVKKTINSVNTYAHFHNAFNLKGIVPGPSNIHLLLDNTWSGYQDYPDSGDNHGSAGSNIAFCDGRVEWIPRNRFIYVHELSQDDNRSGITYP